MVILSRLRRNFPGTFVRKALYSGLEATTADTVTTGCLTGSSDEIVKFVKTNTRTGSRLVTVLSVFPSVRVYGITSHAVRARRGFVSRVGELCPSLGFITYSGSCRGTTEGSSVVMATVSKRRGLLRNR